VLLHSHLMWRGQRGHPTLYQLSRGSKLPMSFWPPDQNLTYVLACTQAHKHLYNKHTPHTYTYTLTYIHAYCTLTCIHCSMVLYVSLSYLPFSINMASWNYLRRDMLYTNCTLVCVHVPHPMGPPLSVILHACTDAYFNTRVTWLLPAELGRLPLLCSHVRCLPV
jgi:hypothetical protein